MLNFRQFEAGPDPFGRKYQVLFKWLQTAISLRHSDTVDVKFILTDDAGVRTEKCIALPHAELRNLAAKSGRTITDSWCARMAATHLLTLVETAEDLEKDLVTLSPAQLAELAARTDREETGEIGRRKGAA